MFNPWPNCGFTIIFHKYCRISIRNDKIQTQFMLQFSKAHWKINRKENKGRKEKVKVKTTCGKCLQRETTNAVSSGTLTALHCYSAYFPEVESSSDLAGIRTCTSGNWNSVLSKSIHFSTCCIDVFLFPGHFPTYFSVGLMTYPLNTKEMLDKESLSRHMINLANC